MTTVHVVSHTHWDREWYQPAVRFRQRLVALVDELIDSPALSHAGASFLLDGQMAVIEDYLSVRRERAAELSMMLKSGVIALYYRCKEQPSPAPTRGTLHGRGADGGGREGSGARESSLGLIREVGRVATS